MSVENSSRITLNGSINHSKTMPVLDTVMGHVPLNIKAFETTPFVNARSNEESVGRALDVAEMIALKREIWKIVQRFNSIVSGNNLSNEQLQVAKLVYIFNHILNNVRYANVLSAGDGTERVRSRSDDFNVYESAYTALISKSSVCCGISDAVYLLCMAMGVECEKWLWPNGGHAFNKVKIGNTWYKLDATFQIGFYPNAKANEWSTNYFLTATEQPSPNLNQVSSDYPRQQIQLMKLFLESRGVSFNYSSAPRITINTPLDGIKYMNSELNQAADFSNLLHNISEIDKAMSSKSTITIHNRSGVISPLNEKSVINYVPADKKIVITRTNYKINIISVNEHYVINVEDSNNNQQTFVTDIFGNIIGELKRKLGVFKGSLDLMFNNTEMITINNRTDGNTSPFRIR